MFYWISGLFSKILPSTEWYVNSHISPSTHVLRLLNPPIGNNLPKLLDIWSPLPYEFGS